MADDDFARAKPLKEAFPKPYQAWKKRRGRPIERPKVHVGFRLAADVVAGIKATGKGCNTHNLQQQ